jgi:hypothetical protein
MLFGYLRHCDDIVFHHITYVNELKPELHVNNIYKSSSYLTGNTLRLHYRDQPVNDVGEIIAVYCENHTEHINTLCGQNAETLYIRIQFVPHRKHITSPLQGPAC